MRDQIFQKLSKFLDKPTNTPEWIPGKDTVMYSGPYFDQSEYLAAIDALLDGWLVLGKRGLEFEHSFPRYLGKQHGLLTNSGSSANLLMMSALRSKRSYNLPKTTKVITPIAGFPTTLNPIIQVGFEPVFVDIELDSLNLDLDQVEYEAQHGAKIITFAHVLGNPPNMTRLMDIVSKYDLILLEDCCDALGSTFDGKPLGGFGIMSSCSFYPAHHITMGEGGFVATQTKELEIITRSFREWGRGCYCTGPKANKLKNGMCGSRFSNWLPSLPDEIFDHKYVYDEIGFNLKPIEIQAAIGLEQIKKLPNIHQKRKDNFKKLYNIFAPFQDHFILPKATNNSDPSWFAFAITIKDNRKFNRSLMTNYLEEHKIQTRPYFAGNILLQPAYDGMMSYDDLNIKYPNARKVTTDTFFLGTSPVITDCQLDYIEEIVNNFMKAYS
jgi:CDP-6-deoxy-D-xylo-4-hexulose-3-dehydrase